MRTEVKYILELIRDKTITIDNGTDRILNLFGVSVNEVEFCNCGNPSGGHVNLEIYTYLCKKTFLYTLLYTVRLLR